MKKAIYEQRGHQHGLFSRDNFDDYIKSMDLDRSAFISSYKIPSIDVFCTSYLLPSGVVLTYERKGTPERNVFDVTVSLTGNKRKIGGVEKKILKDAARFKEDSKKVRRHTHAIADDTVFGRFELDGVSDHPDKNFD